MTKVIKLNTLKKKKKNYASTQNTFTHYHYLLEPLLGIAFDRSI